MSFKPFPKQALVFTCLENTSFENTVGNLVPFSQNLKCHLPTHSVWKSLKLGVWERVKVENIREEGY